VDPQIFSQHLSADSDLGSANVHAIVCKLCNPHPKCLLPSHHLHQAALTSCLPLTAEQSSPNISQLLRILDVKLTCNDGVPIPKERNLHDRTTHGVDDPPIWSTKLSVLSN